MTTIMLSVSAEGALSPAPDGAVPGLSAGGLRTYAFENLPGHATAEDLINFLHGKNLPANLFVIDFAEMKAARSSCCGCCG